MSQDIKRAVKEAIRRGLEEGIVPTMPFAAFGFSEDPFSDNLPDKNEYSFYERKDPLISVVEKMARCIKSNTGFLVVGPGDVGKTIALKYAARLFNEEMEELGHMADYIDAKSWILNNNNENPDKGEVADFKNGFDQWLVDTDFSKTSALIIDHADMVLERLDVYCREIRAEVGEKPFCIVCVLSPLVYDLMLQDIPEIKDEFFADVLWIRPMKKEEIIPLLKTRMDSVRMENFTKESKDAEITPFTEESLNLIAEHSFGLPGLALYIARECMRQAHDFGKDIIDKDIVDFSARALGFDVARQIVEGKLKFSKTKREILESVVIRGRFATIQKGVTGQELLQKLEVAPSTLSYHFQDMSSKGVLVGARIGLNVFYRVKRPVKDALEIIFSPVTLMVSVHA